MQRLRCCSLTPRVGVRAAILLIKPSGGATPVSLLRVWEEMPHVMVFTWIAASNPVWPS